MWGNVSNVNGKKGITDSVIVITRDWKEICQNITSSYRFSVVSSDCLLESGSLCVAVADLKLLSLSNLSPSEYQGYRLPSLAPHFVLKIFSALGKPKAGRYL